MKLPGFIAEVEATLARGTFTAPNIEANIFVWSGEKNNKPNIFIVARLTVCAIFNSFGVLFLGSRQLIKFLFKQPLKQAVFNPLINLFSFFPKPTKSSDAWNRKNPFIPINDDLKNVHLNSCEVWMDRLGHESKRGQAALSSSINVHLVKEASNVRKRTC